MKLGIVGYGYVGKAIESFLLRKYKKEQIFIYDPCTDFNTEIETNNINHCDITFICVPTNEKQTGECDISVVDYTVNWVKSKLLVIKSTVPPGTTEELSKKYNKRIVFSPEFVGETKYGDSHLNFGMNLIHQSHYIFGGNLENTTELVNLYKGIAGPDKEYIQTESKVAELTKYTLNSFFFTKLIFFYDFHEYCKKINVDTNTVRELVTLDPRINKWHTTVFEENEKPVGGKCLPKDTIALVKDSESKGYSPELIKKGHRLNNSLGELRKRSW